MKNDPVLKAMQMALTAIPADQAFNEERRELRKAIAVQKQQLRVIKAAREFEIKQPYAGLKSGFHEERVHLDYLLSKW